MIPNSWLLLLYTLPAKRGAGRVSLWRKLKKFGALQLKTSAYILPDSPAHLERFQWLVQQVRDEGGEATLVRGAQIEGLSGREITRMFSEARGKDYAVLMKSLLEFIQRNKKRRCETFTSELEKFHQLFQEIRGIDYFDSSAAQEAQMLLRRAEALIRPSQRTPLRVAKKDFAGKTWLTRPRPEIDRVGSAWLIRKFIDPGAKFVFAALPSAHPKAIPYDMLDVEFTHQGDDCTFETFLKRFGIKDAAALQIGEMIHDADLEDDKFHRSECVGLDRVFKGWGKLGLPDDEILALGFHCFDALYACVTR